MDKKTVLVVEDDALMLHSVVLCLEKEFTVLEASDGKKAWNIAKERHIDCIVTDIEMPNMSGLELLDKLKENSHSAKAIVISGRNCPDTKKRSKELGASLYLLKPYSITELIECIHKILKHNNREI